MPSLPAPERQLAAAVRHQLRRAQQRGVIRVRASDPRDLVGDVEQLLAARGIERDGVDHAQLYAA